MRFDVMPRLRENFGRLPYASGETASKVRFRRTSEVPVIGFSIEAPTDQARWREEGTDPHVIPFGGARAQMAKGYPLRFYWHRVGKVVMFWSVRHPGQRARPTFSKVIAQGWREGMRRRLGRAA